jgi:hypothetical protein
MNRIRNNRGLEASIRSKSRVEASDQWLSKEIDRMDGAELWRACFLGGMEESRYRGLEASIKSIKE